MWGLHQDYIESTQKAGWARHQTHTSNSSYSGDRDQEDCSSKPVEENSSQDPVSKRRADGVAQGVGPEFKPQYQKKKKKLWHR
jgi:hypothetical protein